MSKMGTQLSLDVNCGDLMCVHEITVDVYDPNDNND